MLSDWHTSRIYTLFDYHNFTTYHTSNKFCNNFIPAITILKRPARSARLNKWNRSPNHRDNILSWRDLLVYVTCTALYTDSDTLPSPIQFFSMRSILMLLCLHVELDYINSKIRSIIPIDKLGTPASTQKPLVNYNLIKMSQDQMLLLTDKLLYSTWILNLIGSRYLYGP